MRKNLFSGMGIGRRTRGLVRLELCGAQPEAVLNACALEGVSLMALESVDSYTLRVTVFEKERQQFEQLARRCYCDTSFLAAGGGSKDRALLLRRRWLWLFALLAAALLCVSSLFIWEIDVVGAQTLSRGAVLRALADCGVESGCFWPSLSVDAVRSCLLNSLPELAWVSVNVRGSRAVVLLLERTDVPEIDREDGAVDLIASRSGIVSRLSVLRGRALVEPGSSVVEGEVLVSGTVDSLTGAPRTLRAKASVMADTWYESTAFCPLDAEQKGRERTLRNRFALKIGDRRINFYFSSGKPIDGCDKIIHETTLGVSGLFALPLRLVREEYIRCERPEAEQDMSKLLQQRLYEQLAAHIDGEICSASYAVSAENGLLAVTLRAHCLENIACPVERDSAED